MPPFHSRTKYKSIALGRGRLKVAGRPGDPYFDSLTLDDGTNDLLLAVAGALSENSIVFDVGANIGLTSAILATLAPAGQVLSFEPSPSTFHLLQRTLALNGLRNCKTFQLAFGAARNRLEFFDNTESASASHLSLGGQSLGGANCRVDVRTIDDFVAEHKITRIDLIKVDVEGFEADVLKGAASTLRTLQPALLVEFNSFTLIAYGNVNPRSFLEELLEQFPYVYYSSCGQMIEIRDEGSQLEFLHNNLVKHGCVDDLYCCNRVWQGRPSHAISAAVPRSFVSYAQNFEDVILWRALKHVEKGCYVDVGANDPVNDSVSLAFYERGWRGVHVEPMPEYAAKLRAARPDEIVIEAAIGLGTEPTRLFSFDGTGMTTSRREFAEKHRLAGHSDKSLVVPTRTLAFVLGQIGRDVHWMKIDVEGMEAAVLRSWQGSDVRPWVLVIESVLPNEARENCEEWESLVLDLGYERAYFDGLNRFYVHRQHTEQLAAFGPGPNVFDEFTLSENSPFVTQLRGRLEAEIALRQQLANELTEARQQVRSLKRSASWRITAPLRFVVNVTRNALARPR